MAEESKNPPPKLAGEMIKIDNLEIRGHPLDRFAMREGTTLAEAALGLRDRVANSSLFQELSGGGFLFRDKKDKSIIFVIQPGKRRDSYFLATVLIRDHLNKLMKK